MVSKITGIVLLFLVFAGLFYVSVKISSLEIAVFVWGIAILLLGIIILAVMLITR